MELKSKSELIKYLTSFGIRIVEGKYVSKKDIKKISGRKQKVKAKLKEIPTYIKMIDSYRGYNQMINKLELKKQLREMGIKIEGNYVRRKDIENILGNKIVSVTYKKALTYENDFYPIRQTKYKGKGTNEVWYVDLGEKNKVAEIDSHNLKFVARNEKDHGNIFESVYELSSGAKLVSTIWKEDLADGGM